jgi:actin-related protein
MLPPPWGSPGCAAARYAAWMGGAVLSKVVFQQGHAIGKFDYDEVGPAVVHRKCC